MVKISHIKKVLENMSKDHDQRTSSLNEDVSWFAPISRKFDEFLLENDENNQHGLEKFTIQHLKTLKNETAE
ncbi:hypothetical protein JCM19055_2966 [Geomicrobium sp. JCM 19055]|nr:hypothetical protein JCM19055_2966 [Geomicrobium sp. JCM 19055]